ncbi:MAG: SDR family NAD(P)-dependent oxidoreductase [Pseudobdellovibrionaceae bacterium]
MTGLLDGRIALVTGASRGIGAEVAKLYARAGAHVILLARSTKSLEEVDDVIRSEGGSATLMPFDLQNIDLLEALGPTIAERFGRLDIWVGNAGILPSLMPVSHSKIVDWQDVFHVNVLANVQMIRTLEPLLKASDAGRAMVTGSGLGVDAYPFYGAYGASKAAVMHLFKTWAEEVRHTSLKVNIVRPGAVDTEMLHTAFPGGYQGHDLRTPAQVAPLFLHLAKADCPHHGAIICPEDYGF